MNKKWLVPAGFLFLFALVLGTSWLFVSGMNINTINRYLMLYWVQFGVWTIITGYLIVFVGFKFREMPALKLFAIVLFALEFLFLCNLIMFQLGITWHPFDTFLVAFQFVATIPAILILFVAVYMYQLNRWPGVLSLALIMQIPILFSRGFWKIDTISKIRTGEDLLLYRNDLPIPTEETFAMISRGFFGILYVAVVAVLLYVLYNDKIAAPIDAKKSDKNWF